MTKTTTTDEIPRALEALRDRPQGTTYFASGSNRTGEIVEPPAPEPDDACPFCGADWILSDDGRIYGCDVFAGAGEQWLDFAPCCYDQADAVAFDGFEWAYGVSVERVVELIAGPRVEVVEVLGGGDGTILAKLRTVDPAEVLEGGRAKSPSGWRDEIFEEVDRWHRHHPAPQGHKFSVAVHAGIVRVGVAVVGRPVSRLLAKAEPKTLEVTRVAIWGRRELRQNAASKLYSAAGKKAKALGFEKLVTYTLDEEDGTSLRASGFVPVARSKGGSWSREGRERTDQAPTGRKVRWERGLSKRARREVARRAEDFAALEAAPKTVLEAA